MTSADPAADSAGVPWAGRHFEPTAYADDDGSAPPALQAALSATGAQRGPAVFAALSGVRLLVPLLATLGEAAPGPHGRLVDKSADLALVTVAGPDGRTVLPAFASVEALSRWNRAARPVPVGSERLALAAVAEGTDLVVLDPGSPTEFALRRPAVWALARGQAWVPSFQDDAVLAAFRAGAADEPAVRGIALQDGDPDGRLTAPELVVQLELEAGLDAPARTALLGRLSAAWSTSELIAERVDSLTLKLVRSVR